MWHMILSFVIFIAVRYFLKLYQQKCALEQLEKAEAEEREKLESDFVAADSKVVDQPVRNEVEEDYDEESTGHNVTKILTATGSRKFHLTPEQIGHRDKVNKELMERLAKRKAHDE